MAIRKTALTEEIQFKKPYFADVEGEQVVQLEIATLFPFENHPFQVLEDDKMAELVESIEKYGVATPIIVREKGRGDYEIIAGHRRTKACELLNLTSIPSFIRDLDDEEATLFMVDTNIQREEILPSEKAFAYKMKLEAIKKQGQRQDLTCSQVGNKLKLGKKSAEIVAEESGESKNQIFRFIRLTHLISPLLSLVDTKKLPFNVAVVLSYLPHEEQELLQAIMEEKHLVPTLNQAERLKNCSKEGGITQTVAESILLIPKEQKVSIQVETSKYFPKKTSKSKMEEVIHILLKEWKESGREL